jgi:hypothetical protein
MHLNDLFSERFGPYFTAAHSGDPLWLFVHVPKTAGSSLNGELSPILAPADHLFIDYSRLNATEASQSYEQLFDQRVDHFIEQSRVRHFRFCTGHINAAQVERIVAQVPDTRPITLLRHPVARFVSDYRYQCSDMHPGHQHFRHTYPTIHHYLELQGDWNKITTSLVPAPLRETNDAQACADWLIRTYAFIGLQEMYDLSLHALSWFAGVPRRPHVRRRINTPTAENEVILTASLEADIRERNALDMAVYEAIAPGLIAIAPALATYLDRVAPRPRARALATT